MLLGRVFELFLKNCLGSKVINEVLPRYRQAPSYTDSFYVSPINAKVPPMVKKPFTGF